MQEKFCGVPISAVKTSGHSPAKKAAHQAASRSPHSMKLTSHATHISSPWFVLRCLISMVLGRSNQVLQSYRKDRISHVNLEQDLRVLLPQSGALLFDVGANKGQTIAMFRRTFNQPVIHAFEPNKSLVETVLTPAHAGNSKVVINAAALGAEDGSLTFNECENNELSSFLPMESSAQNPFKDDVIKTSTTVPVWTLDGYVTEHKLPPLALLKIDTQGALTSRSFRAHASSSPQAASRWSCWRSTSSPCTSASPPSARWTPSCASTAMRWWTCTKRFIRTTGSPGVPACIKNADHGELGVSKAVMSFSPFWSAARKPFSGAICQEHLMHFTKRHDAGYIC